MNEKQHKLQGCRYHHYFISHQSSVISHHHRLKINTPRVATSKNLLVLRALNRPRKQAAELINGVLPKISLSLNTQTKQKENKEMANGEVMDGFRLWPVLSTAALRRKLLEAVLCGGGGIHRSEFVSPERPSTGSKRNGRSDLAELLKAEMSEREKDDEIKKKVKILEELQSVARRLRSSDSRKDAAMEVRRLAKDNAEARETLAMLGAIPTLVELIASEDLDLRIESLYAVLNLGIGNDLNKAAIVKAGAVHRMLSLIKHGSSQPSPSLSEAIVANFLSLSALDSNKTVVGASGAVAFLVDTFRNADSKTRSQARLDSLRSLFNLSISAQNVSYLVESELVPCLFAAIGDMEVSERVLSVLSNLVGWPEGRRAVSRSPEAFSILVDVLNWCDSPECQEKAAYILMIMAHKSYSDRASMVEAGIMTSLLELTLMGSALAQKRASRILEILRIDKGKQISEGFVGCSGSSSGAPPISGPLGGGASEECGDDEEEEVGLSEERKAVKELVQQSLHNNMRRIVRRANLPQDFVASSASDSFAVVTGTLVTSKSLPF